MDKKRVCLRSSRGASGWVTLFNFILVLIAIGVGLSKLMDRFAAIGKKAENVVGKKPAKTAKASGAKQESPKKAEEKASAEEEIFQADGSVVEQQEEVQETVAFEVPAETVIEMMSETDESEG